MKQTGSGVVLSAEFLSRDQISFIYNQHKGAILCLIHIVACLGLFFAF